MSERDELAEELAAAYGESPSSADDDAADAILAAGYVKPRTITTVEELDALPIGSVVLSDAYRYMMHGGADCGWRVSFQRWNDRLWHRGGRASDTHPDNFLPATVLYEGTTP